MQSLHCRFSLLSQYLYLCYAEERKNSRNTLDPEQKEEERKKHKKAVKDWIKHIQKESAKAFLPA